MKLEKGLVSLQVQSITNLDQIKSNLKITLEKYEGIVWTEENRKDIQNVIEELKSPRTDVKKFAAAFNKEGTAKVKEVYNQIKEVEQMITDIIAPLEKSEKEYLEQKRLEKFIAKKTKFQPVIDELNTIIAKLNKGFGYILHEQVEFLEEWAKDSEEKINSRLIDVTKEVSNTRSKLLDKIEAVNIACESLKGTYDLSMPLNWKLILGNKVYTESLVDLKAILEDFAENQQIAEMEAVEREAENLKMQQEILPSKKEKTIPEEVKEDLPPWEQEVVQETSNQLVKEHKITVHMVVKSNSINIEEEIDSCLSSQFNVTKIQVKEV